MTEDIDARMRRMASPPRSTPSELKGLYYEERPDYTDAVNDKAGSVAGVVGGLIGGKVFPMSAVEATRSTPVGTTGQGSDGISSGERQLEDIIKRNRDPEYDIQDPFGEAIKQGLENGQWIIGHEKTVLISGVVGDPCNPPKYAHY